MEQLPSLAYLQQQQLNYGNIGGDSGYTEPWGYRIPPERHGVATNMALAGMHHELAQWHDVTHYLSLAKVERRRQLTADLRRDFPDAQVSHVDGRYLLQIAGAQRAAHNELLSLRHAILYPSQYSMQQIRKLMVDYGNSAEYADRLKYHALLLGLGE